MSNVVAIKNWTTIRKDLEDDVAGAAEEILKAVAKQGDKLDKMHETLIRAVTTQEGQEESIKKLEKADVVQTKKINSLENWRAGLAAAIAVIVGAVGWLIKIFPWNHK